MMMDFKHISIFPFTLSSNNVHPNANTNSTAWVFRAPVFIIPVPIVVTSRGAVLLLLPPTLPITLFPTLTVAFSLRAAA